MKKIILLVLVSIVIVSCDQKAKNYVTFSGKITNKNSNKLTISDRDTGYKKDISVAEDGTFKDTLRVKAGFYRMFDGGEFAQLFLENGDEINVTLDTKQFDETITFTGKGSEESAFLAKSTLKKETFLGDKVVMSLEKTAFDEKLNAYIAELNNSLTNENGLNSSFVTSQKSAIEENKKSVGYIYTENRYILENLAKGKSAPKFVDYENIKGGKTSLDDLKGKFLYIDVWATWCKPCKDEIPALKKLVAEFEGKNIEFVSISVDDKRNYEDWKIMVSEKQMGGVQLYSNKDLKFMDDYRVSSIPRFILLDPNGNIVDANAPRPSQPEIAVLLKSLVQ